MTLTKKISPLIVITATFVLLALAWNVFVPAYENLDEIEHTEVIRYIAVTGRLPIHGEAEAAGFHVRQEASQPPLYHLIGALWVRLWGLPRTAPAVEAVPGGVVACGDLETLYNKATWVHQPDDSDVPYTGHRRTVHGLRLLSTLLQVGTVVGTWFLAQRLFSRRVATLATSIVAFNPQFLLVAAGVNNDNLVTPLATGTLLLLLTLWQGKQTTGPTPKQLLLLGILGGLAGLSKLSGLGLLGLSGLVLLIMAIRRRVAFGQLLSWWTLVSLPALILMGPWIWRNVQLYGDPTALTPMLEKVGRRTSAINPLNELHLMWRSYWGQLPCAFYPRALYWSWTLLGVVGVLGCILSFPKLRQKQKAGLIGLSAWFTLIVAAWVRWDMLTPAPGGRLLFPAAPALALGIAVGWERLGGRVGRRRLTSNVWLVGLPLLALITLRVGLFPIFVPPGQVEARALPTEQTREYTFGKKIALRAYEIRLRRAPLACWLVRSSYCRPTLDVTFYWEARTLIPEDHVMTLQLVSAQPGDDTLRLSYNRWPGRGTLPTSNWPTGVTLKDTYHLPIPATEQPTQAWDVKLGFFDLETERRLAVEQGDVNVGTLAPLTTLRVPGRSPQCEESDALAEEIHFGGAIALTHAGVDVNATPREVTLCWESLAPVSEDYTVFVHAYDDAGALLGTGDAPPMQQAFPTRLWQPGDRVRDRHTLTLDQAGDVQQLVIGLYDPQSGLRLPAVEADTRLPNDAVTVWEETP